MSEYVFHEHQGDRELERLRLIELLLDPASRSHLQAAGLASGWRCLEVGAGAGSIAAWLGSIVGASGRVVSIDRHVQYLEHLSVAPHEVVAGDFLELEIVETFDLAHCRYVLIHNADSQGVLRKLVDAVEPGGRLVLEEPDFTSAERLGTDGDAAQQRVYTAVCQLFRDRGLEPDYGFHLPSRLADLGLEIEHVDTRLHLARGGSPMAQMMAASTSVLAEKYLATGKASASDIAQYLSNAGDDNFWTIYYATTSVIATKAG